MLSADAVNLELLRQGNRIMQQKVTALGSQLRAAEQKCEVLQTKLLQMEQTEIERSCKHDSHEEAQMNAVLKQLLSECVDIEDFMTSSRAGVADRATELSEDHKHALAETKSLRFELTQVEVKLKCTESAVKEANALLSKEVEQREAIQEHERALMEQVKDLQDESRHTRTQCDGLKNKLHEERNRCRQLELEGKRMQQAR